MRMFQPSSRGPCYLYSQSLSSSKCGQVLLAHALLRCINLTQCRSTHPFTFPPPTRHVPSAFLLFHGILVSHRYQEQSVSPGETHSWELKTPQSDKSILGRNINGLRSLESAWSRSHTAGLRMVGGQLWGASGGGGVFSLPV